MNAPITIGRLSASDVPRVMQLYRLSILPVWLKNGREHSFERIEANIRARLDTANYWMVTARSSTDPTGPLAGYLAWERHEDHTSNHVVAHLRMLLVHPSHQGTGLGKRLMQQFEPAAEAAGCTKILFDVITGSPAREFYESLGYRHWSDFMEKRI